VQGGWDQRRWSRCAHGRQRRPGSGIFSLIFELFQHGVRGTTSILRPRTVESECCIHKICDPRTKGLFTCYGSSNAPHTSACAVAFSPAGTQDLDCKPMNRHAEVAALIVPAHRTGTNDPHTCEASGQRKLHLHLTPVRVAEVNL
jgi:hypothetical protein